MHAHTMIDHVSLGTKRLAQAITFYETCLSGLGYGLLHQTEKEAAFGADGKWEFWLYSVAPEESVVGARSHVAIAADSCEKVVRFFEDAMRKAATVVRPPGGRPDIGPDYFGTVIRDLDGHTIEVVHWAR
jgi:catechol 2,3-dioxygenase-like lactoylglutathione lyase family enzyme